MTDKIAGPDKLTLTYRIWWTAQK